MYTIPLLAQLVEHGYDVNNRRMLFQLDNNYDDCSSSTNEV
jgi:hypothetical protein